MLLKNTKTTSPDSPRQLANSGHPNLDFVGMPVDNPVSLAALRLIQFVSPCDAHYPPRLQGFWESAIPFLLTGLLLILNSQK
jgi:hypothetical protein